MYARTYVISQSRWGHCEGTSSSSGSNSDFQPNHNINTGGTKVLPEAWCVWDTGGDSTGTAFEDHFDYRLQLMNMYGGRFAASGYESSVVGVNWQVGDQNVCYLGTDIFYRASGSTTLPF